MTLDIGQKLWWVPANRWDGAARWVTVVKVGRKWAELDNRNRISIETWTSERGTYGSTGQCYRDAADYKRVTDLIKEWSEFLRIAKHTRPPGPVERIRQAASILGIEYKVTE